MKIIWFTWKDMKNPASGGAEYINEELAKKLVNNGHKIIFLVAGFNNCVKKENINGYTIIRLGNRYTIYIHAFIYFLRYLYDWPDLIIEEINTIPFFTQLYSRKKRVLLIYQLCKEIWFYQARKPFSYIGYIAESIYLYLLKGNYVLTESQSTKDDLVRHGFNKAKISIFPIFINSKNFIKNNKAKKDTTFTLLSLGNIRRMKRTHHQILAFTIAKKEIPELKLIIAGGISDKKYGDYVLNLIKNNPYNKDIEYLASISTKQKFQLLQKSHIHLITSVKEGWGLTVTEAASQATPTISYDIDGIRDSVINNKTGILVENNSYEKIAEAIIMLYKNKMMYDKLTYNAWNHSKQYIISESYRIFSAILYNRV